MNKDETNYVLDLEREASTMGRMAMKLRREIEIYETARFWIRVKYLFTGKIK